MSKWPKMSSDLSVASTTRSDAILKLAKMEDHHTTTTGAQVSTNTMKTKMIGVMEAIVTVVKAEVLNVSIATPAGSTTSTNSSSNTRTAVKMTKATMTLVRVKIEEMAKLDFKMVSSRMAKDGEVQTPMETISLQLQAIGLSGRCQATITSPTMPTDKIVINSTIHMVSIQNKVAVVKRDSPSELSDKNEARTIGELLKCTLITTKAPLIISSASSRIGAEIKATMSKRAPTLLTATGKAVEVAGEARPWAHRAGEIRETKRSSTSPMAPILNSPSPGSNKEVRTTEISFKSSQSRTWVAVVEARIGLMLSRVKAEVAVRGKKKFCRLMTRRTEMCSAVPMTLATQETSSTKLASRLKTSRLSDFRTSLVLKKLKPQTHMNRWRATRTESS